MHQVSARGRRGRRDLRLSQLQEDLLCGDEPVRNGGLEPPISAKEHDSPPGSDRVKRLQARRSFTGIRCGMRSLVSFGSLGLRRKSAAWIARSACQLCELWLSSQAWSLVRPCWPLATARMACSDSSTLAITA